jgi:hypothetical protein
VLENDQIPKRAIQGTSDAVVNLIHFTANSVSTSYKGTEEAVAVFVNFDIGVLAGWELWSKEC